jgi:lipoprotein-anchoring transpeptidase ErfK/SrfK
MRPGRGLALQASWLATALSALLAVATPVAAGLTHDDPSAGGARTVGSGALRGRALHGYVQPFEPPQPANRAPTQVVRTSEQVIRTSESAWDLAVQVPSGGLAAHRNPWARSPLIGTVVSSSKYYHVPLVAWVEEVSRNGAWGRVELPYVWPRREGWIALRGLSKSRRTVEVRVDLSDHRVRVYEDGRRVGSFPAAIGAPWSPTPVGEYFVTDRVPFSAGSSLGTFAFGISGIQPRLPAGWSGGDQLAIHGTNEPWSIGTNASAGCVRVSEAALDRLKPLLRLGTPVTISA